MKNLKDDGRFIGKLISPRFLSPWFLILAIIKEMTVAIQLFEPSMEMPYLCLIEGCQNGSLQLTETIPPPFEQPGPVFADCWVSTDTII